MPRPSGPRKGRTVVWTKHPQYSRWRAMFDRCYSPKNKKYPLYGGRGITVCERWRDFELFLEDIAPLGPCPPKYSIDRINNDLGYELGNVRWASAKTQLQNRRPYTKQQPRTKVQSHAKNVVVENGVEIPVRVLAARLDCRWNSIVRRLKRMRDANPALPREVDIEVFLKK